MVSLLELPNELLLQVFHRLSTVQDALSFAQTSSHLHKLFENGGNRMEIFYSIICGARKLAGELEEAFSSEIDLPYSCGAGKSLTDHDRTRARQLLEVVLARYQVRAFRHDYRLY